MTQSRLQEFGTSEGILVRSTNWRVNPIAISDIEIEFDGERIPLVCDSQILFGVVEAFEELACYVDGDVGEAKWLTTRELLDGVRIQVMPLGEECASVTCDFEGGEVAIRVTRDEAASLARELRSHFDLVNETKSSQS